MFVVFLVCGGLVVLCVSIRGFDVVLFYCCVILRFDLFDCWFWDCGFVLLLC